MSNGGAQHWSHQFIDSSGNPYSGVKVYHTAAGTDTLKNVWTDEGKVTPAANPVVGDSSGMVSFYADGDYKFVIKDTADVTLYTWDNIKITSDTATLWEGNVGTAYPSVTANNLWQQFLLKDASNNLLGLGINTGTEFVPFTPGVWSNDSDASAVANKTMILSSTVTLTANTIIPASVSIMPINPGVIVSNGFTLTINGPPVGNPMHQWLSGFAAGEVTGLKRVKEEWFGSIPLAVGSGGVIELEKSDYTVSSVINPAEGQHIFGQSMSATANKGTRLTLNFDDDMINLGSLFQRLENFYVDCNTKNGNGVYLVCNYATLNKIQIKNVKTGYWALNIAGASHNSYYDVYIIDCQNGINMSSASSGSFSSFYGCSVLSDNGLMETAVKLSVTNIVFAVNFYNLLIGPGVGKALDINNIANSVIDGIYLEAAFLNTADLITITGTATRGFTIKHGVISQTHASFNYMFVRASGGGKNLRFESIFFSKVSADTSDVLNFTDITGVIVTGCELTAPAGSYFLSDSSGTEGIIIEDLISTNTTTIAFFGSKHHVTGGSSNITIDIRNTANDITIENFPGTITINASAVRVVLINCTGSITDTGNVATILGPQAAANADTTGATLGNLEIEVNQLKQLLRDAGLMAT